MIPGQLAAVEGKLFFKKIFLTWPSVINQRDEMSEKESAFIWIDFNFTHLQQWFYKFELLWITLFSNLIAREVK